MGKSLTGVGRVLKKGKSYRFCVVLPLFAVHTKKKKKAFKAL